MTGLQEQIYSEYTHILGSFMATGGEASLQEGYEWGRRAIEAKFGLLQVIEIHQKALGEILVAPPGESQRMLQAAGAFLLTSLAPFEMTHRGFQDSVSKLQQLNEELSHQATELSAVNEELEAFSYSVSHDLRAPLRSILGFSKILLEDHSASLDEETKMLASRVVTSAHRMGKLIEGLLRLSKLNRKTLRRDAINLTQMANEILRELQSSTPERQVSISIAEDLRVNGDFQLLEAALSNLLANAWKFTSKKVDARIEFGTLYQDGRLVYFIRDNGAGFDMRYAEKLFGAFQRLHSEDQFEGTGIGLATARRIIQRHGGRLWATGEVDQGATFYFTVET